MILLLAGIGGAWAEDFVISYANGAFNNASPTQNRPWNNTWTSSQTDPQVSMVCYETGTTDLCAQIHLNITVIPTQRTVIESDNTLQQFAFTTGDKTYDYWIKLSDANKAITKLNFDFVDTPVSVTANGTYGVMTISGMGTAEVKINISETTSMMNKITVTYQSTSSITLTSASQILNGSFYNAAGASMAYGNWCTKCVTNSSPAVTLNFTEDVSGTGISNTSGYLSVYSTGTRTLTISMPDHCTITSYTFTGTPTAECKFTPAGGSKQTWASGSEGSITVGVNAQSTTIAFSGCGQDGNKECLINNVTLTINYTSTIYKVKVLGITSGTAGVTYQNTSYGNGSTISASNLAATDLTANAIAGENASVSISGYDVTVTYKPNNMASKYILNDKATASTDAIVEGQWYLLVQGRKPNTSEQTYKTPVYDTGAGNQLYRAAQAITPTSVLGYGHTASDYAKYFIRFFKTGLGANDYGIQFATGNFWNGVYSNATTATSFLVYTATETATTADYTTGWALNKTTDGTTYGSKVDNNGYGGTVAFWSSGQTTEGTNNVWQLFPVTLGAEIEDYGKAMNVYYTDNLIANKVQKAGTLGYPKTTTTSYTNLTTLLNDWENQTNATGWANLKSYYPAYADETDIVMPTDGKVYTFTNVQQNGTKIYLYDNSGTLALTKTKPTDGTDEFVCHVTSGNKYVFVSKSGKYVQGASNVDNGALLNDSYNAATEDVAIAKFPKSGGFVSTTSDFAFGKVTIITAQGAGGRTSGTAFIVKGADPRFDKADCAYLNDSYSSAYNITEASDYYNKVTLTTDGTDAYASLYLPFAVTIPSGVTAYAVTSQDGSSAQMGEIVSDGTLPKKTATILVKSGQTANETVYLSPAVEAGSYSGVNQLGGTVTTTTRESLGTGTTYVLGNTSGMGLYSYTGTNLAKGKAYLFVSGSGVKSLSFDFGTVDGIATAPVDALQEDGKLYNLAGQRVSKPTRGLYIKNGKKYMVK